MPFAGAVHQYRQQHFCERLHLLKVNSNNFYSQDNRILKFPRTREALSLPYAKKPLCSRKDAIVATMALCEAAAYYKTKGMTLWDAMVAMYEKYGYYKDDIQSITLKGIEGLEKIQTILENLRKNPPTEIGTYKVLSARDYKADTVVNMETKEVTATGLPSSNVLYYDLNDDAWVCVRPSGTEPKIKIYYGIKGTSLQDADEKSAALGADVKKLIDAMM